MDYIHVSVAQKNILADRWKERTVAMGLDLSRTTNIDTRPATSIDQIDIRCIFLSLSLGARQRQVEADI